MEYVRGLLTNTGVLPARDYYLAAFARWLDAKLSQIDHPEQRRLIDRYARWQLLRRLRAQTRAGQVSQGAFRSAKQRTTVAIMFLNWLHVECATTLPGATQHHLATMRRILRRHPDPTGSAAEHRHQLAAVPAYPGQRHARGRLLHVECAVTLRRLDVLFVLR